MGSMWVRVNGVWVEIGGGGAGNVAMTRLSCGPMTIPDSAPPEYPSTYAIDLDTQSLCTINAGPPSYFEMATGWAHHVSARFNWDLSPFTPPRSGYLAVRSNWAGEVWDDIPQSAPLLYGDVVELPWVQRFGTFIPSYAVPYADYFAFRQNSGMSLDVTSIEIDIVSVPYNWPIG